MFFHHHPDFLGIAAMETYVHGSFQFLIAKSVGHGTKANLLLQVNLNQFQSIFSTHESIHSNTAYKSHTIGPTLTMPPSSSSIQTAGATFGLLIRQVHQGYARR